jgi:two-component system OmpR family sensor kinase
MIRSLRGRLFVGLTAIILLTGAIGSMFAYQWAFGEAIELQDSILIQLASLAQNASFSGGQPLHGVEEDTEVWLIELGKTPRGMADDRQLFALLDGLQVATWKNQPVRVLLRTRSDGSRFAVAQPTAVRDETARDVALRTLLPIAALIPCLMVVTALVIARSLRPMVRLARDLDSRPADDMTPLPLSGMPSELHPFISSINGLLARMRLLMDQQRRFVADAAHELRTPITALSLQAENLESVALPKQAQERVAALKQGMHRTKHLLEQLLALARHEATAAGPAEIALAALDRVAKEVVAGLLPDATDRGIDLGFALAEPLTVRSESVMLAAIIRNLLDNALCFTPRGGTIDIGIYRQDDLAILQVEDTGPGIASIDMDKIFEPFFRSSRPEGEGTGLGLSIVKRIVDSLGGGIALENIAGAGGSGLRVTVRLPIAADPDSTASKDAAEVEKPDGSGIGPLLSRS